MTIGFALKGMKDDQPYVFSVQVKQINTATQAQYISGSCKEGTTTQELNVDEASTCFQDWSQLASTENLLSFTEVGTSLDTCAEITTTTSSTTTIGGGCPCQVTGTPVFDTSCIFNDGAGIAFKGMNGGQSYTLSVEGTFIDDVFISGVCTEGTNEHEFTELDVYNACALIVGSFIGGSDYIQEEGASLDQCNPVICNSDCLVGKDTPGCNNVACNADISSSESSCGITEWDSTCADLACNGCTGATACQACQG